VPGYMTLSLQGDHYSMGRQHGHQVRHLLPPIADLIAARLREVEALSPDAHFQALYQETRELIEEIDRPLSDLIRGQADALGIEFDTLLRCNLAGNLSDGLIIRKHLGNMDCTTWAAAGLATAGGRPILAKNRDSSPEHLRLQCVIRARPESGYRYLYISSAGCPGVYCAGLNQAGLAVADTHVYSTDLGPGLPDYSLMMHILESHDTVSSAIDYLRSVPRLGRHNLILADTHASLAIFEIGHRTFGLREASNGTLVSTNHFVSPEMQASFVDVAPAEERGSSQQRFGRTIQKLDAAFGHIDVAMAQRLMASHDGPLASICCHPKANGGSSTISTGIFLPAQQQMLFCHGLPCQGHWDTYQV
jgi:isopenicillin-N N-acyltransferase-like protein